MSSYQVIDGYDNAGTLAAVSTQPKSQGVFYADEVTGLDGSAHDEGTAFFEWVYTFIPRADLAAVLTELGVPVGTKSNQVTAKTMKNMPNETWQDYNAVVLHPNLDGKHKKGFYRNVVIKFTDAEEI
jgi:hypothetical protein